MSLSTKMLPEGPPGLRSAQAPSAGLTALAESDFQVHLRHKKRCLAGPFHNLTMEVAFSRPHSGRTNLGKEGSFERGLPALIFSMATADF